MDEKDNCVHLLTQLGENLPKKLNARHIPVLNQVNKNNVLHFSANFNNKKKMFYLTRILVNS